MKLVAVLRSAAAVAFAVAAGAILYVAICAAQLVRTGSHDNGRRADVIVVMGAAQYDGVPSPLLESRLRHALGLWKSERAPLIAVTGGKKEGDRFTEAATSRRWLTDNGVPESAIVAEEVGASTWESLEALAPVLRDKKAGKVIAVSSRWHVERVVLSLRDLGFHADGSAARVAGSTWFDEDGSNTATWKEIAGVAVGRILGFERLYEFTG